ncbi:MAG: AMP-binding protein, partial [Candidatus Nanopelagicales bacterium]|nr:AMP-binding protein [Candidatus Nanopelagicales bacterium]
MGPIWTPSPDKVAGARITGFRRDLSDAAGVELATSEDLHRLSVDSCGDFWDAVWGECGVVGDRGDGPAYVLPPAGADMRAAKFFPAAGLNFAENLLAGADRLGAAAEAIVFRREDGVRRVLTWSELHRRVWAFADHLRAVGVKPGDRVAAWMPNVPETVVAMLATSVIGAVFTSTSPDFGVAGVLDRFGQVAPTVLVAADGYVYSNRRHDRMALLAQVVAGLPSLRAIVVHGELDEEPDLSRIRGVAGPRRLDAWNEVIGAGYIESEGH